MTERLDVRGLARRATAEIPVPPRRWKTRILLPFAILGIVAGLVVASIWDVLVPATEVRVVPVVVKALGAGEGSGTVTVQAPGWIEPDPHPTYVTALTPGVVAAVLVLEGDAVEAGQVVVRLVAEDAQIARARIVAVLDERRGAVGAAEADLDSARATIEHLIAKTAELDAANAALAAVTAERVQVEAEIAAAEARVAATADELARKAKLAESQAVAVGPVERLRLRLRAERADLDAARAGLPVVDAHLAVAAARQRAARRDAELLIDERHSLRRAEAGLVMARAAVARAEADLREADLRLARVEVRAAVAGVVQRRLVSPGSRVAVTPDEFSAHVVHLYDPARLQVRVDVPLADIARVGIGQSVEVVVDALPDRVFDGVVSRLVHQADVAKNTVEVKVAIAAPEAVLKPEMLARVRFLGTDAATPDGAVRHRLFAPRRAVRQDGDATRVLVVEGLEDGVGRAASRRVTLGRAVVDDYVEVESGLRAGDQVIVDAPESLAHGDRIAVRGEAFSPAGRRDG